MTQTAVLPLLLLDEAFPDQLFVLHHPSTDRYGCYRHEGIHGLACFRGEPAAIEFAKWIDLSGMMTLEVSFDEARDIAKQRPVQVVSIMLLDRIDDPQIHYVR
jgi:hypothetical protein